MAFAPPPGMPTMSDYDASSASQSGADTVIHVDAAHTLTLANVALNTLDQSHVRFV